MIYIWISMLINQLSFFFLESGMREWTVLLKEVTWLPLIMIQTDSEVWTMTVRFSWIKNLPTITLWEKSHEMCTAFFFQRKCSAFYIKGISFNCIAQINFRPNQRNIYVKRNIYHGFHHIRKNNSILIIIRNHLKCAYNVDFWDIIPQTVRGS